MAGRIDDDTEREREILADRPRVRRADPMDDTDMNILRSIFRAFTGDPGNPHELDYLPMTEQKLPPTPSVSRPRQVPTEPPDWEQKRRDAAQKLVRPFAPDVKTGRVTPPSHMLNHINVRAEEAKRERGTLRLAGGRKS